MDLADFTFGYNFTGLTNDQISTAIDECEVTWSGIYTMWSKAEQVLRDKKRLLCMNYIVAWYLADMYPKAVKDIATMGGIPLSSKSIGGAANVSLSFRERKVPTGMEQFTSNVFGMKALDMIMNSPDMLLIHG